MPSLVPPIRSALTGTFLLGLGLAVVAPTGSAAAPVDGGRLYRGYCSSCHGPTGNGDGPDAAIFSSPPRDLRHGFLKRYATNDLVRRVRDGQPLELALNVAALRAQATEVEQMVAYLKRLPTINWPVADYGQAIYLHRCAACHGPTGRPPTGAPGAMLPRGVQPPRDLSAGSFQATQSESALIELVRHGRKGMPALTPRVSEQDGARLAVFVRLLSPGFELYSRYCANCHGVDGHPVANVAATAHVPTAIFDAAYFARKDPEQLRASVWHMLAEEKPAMPHYRTTLSEVQAAAIIEYLEQVR